MEVVEQDKRKVPIAKKLSKEILNILKNKSSKALIKKKMNTKTCVKNKTKFWVIV